MSIEIDRVLAALPTTERGQATHISCDAKGQRIAYASARSVFLRDIDDPAQSKQYAGHTLPTTVARISPSGFYVASGDTGGHVRVWDAVEAVTTKGDYQPIAGRINDIAWDGDSQRLIAVGAGQKHYGHAFTADSGNSIGEITGHSKTVNAVAMRQQRPLRAATVGDDGAMCFLHGVPFKFNSKVADAHAGFVLDAAYSPDGATLATVGADRRIRLYDGKTGEPTRRIGDGVHTGSVFAVAWAPDSARLATASADQTVRVWDVAAGTCLHSWRVGPDEASVSVPDQQVGVAWPPGRSDDLVIGLGLSGDLRYFVPGKPDPVRVVQGHNKTISALCASSGDAGTDAGPATVLTGSVDGRVCSWDVATGVGRVVDGQTHSSQVTHFAAAGGRLYSVGWDDHLRTVDEAAATFTGSSAALGAQPRGVAAAAAGYVVVATEAALAVYKDDKRVGSVELSFTPTALAAATGGSLVAVGSGSDHGNAIELFDLAGDGKLRASKTGKPPPAQAAVSALALTADGGLLAAGIRTGKVAAYRRGEGGASSSSFTVATERWSAHSAQVTSLAWNAAGTHVVSGSLDTHVFVWSLAEPGRRVQAANAHQGGVNGVAWVDGGNKVASGGFDGAVKIWTVKGLK